MKLTRAVIVYGLVLLFWNGLLAVFLFSQFTPNPMGLGRGGVPLAQSSWFTIVFSACIWIAGEIMGVRSLVSSIREARALKDTGTARGTMSLVGKDPLVPLWTGDANGLLRARAKLVGFKQLADHDTVHFAIRLDAPASSDESSFNLLVSPGLVETSGECSWEVKGPCVIYCEVSRGMEKTLTSPDELPRGLAIEWIIDGIAENHA